MPPLERSWKKLIIFYHQNDNTIMIPESQLLSIQQQKNFIKIIYKIADEIQIANIDYTEENYAKNEMENFFIACQNNLSNAYYFG